MKATALDGAGQLGPPEGLSDDERAHFERLARKHQEQGDVRAVTKT